MINTLYDFGAAPGNFRSTFMSDRNACVRTALIKKLTEVALSAELDDHLVGCSISNRKNGRTRKAIKTTAGSFELCTPRDRANTFEPQFVKKHQIHLTNENEIKILSMFCVGMSYQAIHTLLADIYNSSLSPMAIAAVAEKVVCEVKQFQRRQLESCYSLIWLDVIRCKVKEAGSYANKAIYTVLALTADGEKDVLGLYMAKFENPNFWLGVLRDLQQRGVKDILVAAVDGFTGFPGAIGSIFPNAKVRSCVVNLARSSIPQLASMGREMLPAGPASVYRVSPVLEKEGAL